MRENLMARASEKILSCVSCTIIIIYDTHEREPDGEGEWGDPIACIMRNYHI